jgi:beta-ribofuranosylaminobenzene 5'-phosphate synthase
VCVRAPGRLHLGFLDPAGSLGRRFGSLGLVVDGFDTTLEISAPWQASHRAGQADEMLADELLADGEAAQEELVRVQSHLAALRQHTGVHQRLRLHLKQVLPAHAGWGSGTQLALAVGRAFAAWHGLQLPTTTLAQILGRGLRSGVGIAGFDAGGLLLDGGPGAAGQPAPLLSRQSWPEAWRVITVLDPQRRGLSGAEERQALARLSPLPQAASAELCHQVLMRVLPAVADADFVPFATGLQRVQQILGDHFAPAQQGSAYTSPDVRRVLDWMVQNAGTLAVGQSSWGPTGFAFVPSQAAADRLCASAHTAGVVAPGLRLCTLRGRNQGAVLSAIGAPPSPARVK